MLIVSSNAFVPPPEGLHRAACVDVIDLGMVDGPFGRKHRCRFVFELDARMDDGRPFIAVKTYTVSLHEKSSLHKDLRAWRGHPFSPEELIGFDLERLVGVPCKLFITHTERDGTVFGNITAIIKPDNGKAYQPSGLYQRKDNTGGEKPPVNDRAGATYDDSGAEDGEVPF